MMVLALGNTVHSLQGAVLQLAVHPPFRACGSQRKLVQPSFRLALLIHLQTNTREVVLDPSWRELFTRVYHLMPHLWPSKYPKLQFIAVCTLHLTHFPY